MSETESQQPSGGSPTSLTLTPEEQKLLVRAIELVERDVFAHVVARTKKYLLLVAGILTAFGLITLTNLKTAVSDAVTNKLISDAELRESIKRDMLKKIEDATELVKKSDKLAVDLEKESARVNATLTVELEQIAKMLQQLREDVMRLRPGSVPPSPPATSLPSESSADRKK